MANLIRISLQSLRIIPQEHQLTMHRMYEDNDVNEADRAEEIIDFLESQTPGTFVGILANDSVSPTCASREGHYHCDYYAPYWYTMLISKKVWEQYKDKVEEADQEWKKKHGCKVIA